MLGVFYPKGTWNQNHIPHKATIIARQYYEEFISVTNLTLHIC